MMLFRIINLASLVGAFVVGPSITATFRSCRLRSELFGKYVASSEDLSIEYCTGCRWMMRSAWMANELLTTFEDDLDSVTLIPNRSKPGGVFLVKRNADHILWDRKAEGGFPESKQLKQRVRDAVVPDKSLGHSDSSEEEQQTTLEDCEGCPSPSTTADRADSGSVLESNVSITYCTECRWLLRASWMAQELLTTFPDEINSITLIPSCPPAALGATFRIALNGKLLWDRKERDRFPEPKEIEQMIGNKIAPERDLGHSDQEVDDDVDEMNEDEAEEARKFFGVM